MYRFHQCWAHDTRGHHSRVWLEKTRNICFFPCRAGLLYRTDRDGLERARRHQIPFIFFPARSPRSYASRRLSTLSLYSDDWRWRRVCFLRHARCFCSPTAPQKSCHRVGRFKTAQRTPQWNECLLHILSLKVDAGMKNKAKVYISPFSLASLTFWCCLDVFTSHSILFDNFVHCINAVHHIHYSLHLLHLLRLLYFHHGRCLTSIFLSSGREEAKGRYSEMILTSSVFDIGYWNTKNGKGSPSNLISFPLPGPPYLHILLH